MNLRFQNYLKVFKKKADLNKVREICRFARRKGIVISGAFIIGFPDETKEMSKRTIDYALNLDIHYAQFSIMIPYPGTPMYKKLEEKGYITDGEDKDFVRYNQSVGLTDLDPVYVPNGRDAAELKALQKMAYTKFYFRLKLLLMHLPHLRPLMVFKKFKSFFAIIMLKFKSSN